MLLTCSIQACLQVLKYFQSFKRVELEWVPAQAAVMKLKAEGKEADMMTRLMHMHSTYSKGAIEDDSSVTAVRVGLCLMGITSAYVQCSYRILFFCASSAQHLVLQSAFGLWPPAI